MNIADIMIHIHPDLPTEQREKLEQTVNAHDGVMSVHFSTEHQHQLTIAYNPEKINSESILEQIRLWDRDATMAGL